MGLFDKLFGKKEEINPNHVYAPMAGTAVAISEVPDPTFSSGAMGNGIAIQPTDGKVCSPVNGTVDMMFDTGHAVTLVSESGIEILIHVGLETVGLEGKPFQVKVQNGQKVKKGDVLMIADLEAIKAAGLPTITPVLICNTDDYTTFNTTTGKADARRLMALMKLAAKQGMELTVTVEGADEETAAAELQAFLAANL